MYYIIYKITNKIDGKFYIGSHKTSDPCDCYMGSGKYLKYAQDKYGIENFKKEVLFVYDTSEEMFAKEAEIVNEEFLANENTYNIKVGGFGGWDYVNGNEKPRIEKNRKARTLADVAIKEKYGVDNTSQIPSVRASLSMHMKRRIDEGFKPIPPSFKNKKHSNETKIKIGRKNSQKQAGQGNSQYGTRWIYSDEYKICKKIKKDESLPNGFVEGRKMKF